MQVPTILIGKTTVQVDVKSKADIKYVVFCVDNTIIDLVEDPPYKTIIKNFYNPPFSSHQLGVYAYDSNGKWSRDEMNIITLMTPSIKSK